MSQFNEFDAELAAEAAYGMGEADYDDLAEFNRDEAYDYADEGYDPGEYEPSDEDDMYGGYDDFDEYMSGEY